MTDAELDAFLMSHVTSRWQKAMKIVATVFQSDIDYTCRSELLWGFGDSNDDPLLNLCLARLKHLSEMGRIEAAGDLGHPRFSEVRLPQ